MKPKLLTMGGNSKLGKKIGIFNLPSRKTCPGRTKECGKICYAQKAERLYPNALPSRERNLILSRRKDFADKMAMDILVSRTDHVRLHEAGDFYNQAYLDKWLRITSICKDTLFLAFTKSLHLDFRGVPKNFVLYSSIDTTSKHKPLPRRKTALTLPPGATAIQGRYTCPPIGKNPVTFKRDKDHYHYCGVSCRYCWDNRGDVAWIKH